MAVRTAQRVFRRGLGEDSGLSAIHAKTSRGARQGLPFPDDPLAGVSDEYDTLVDSYSASGFVVNGVYLRGAVLLLPRLNLLFDVASLEELTPRSLDVLALIDFQPDMLVIGTGRTLRQPPREALAFLEELGINVELAATPQASATFNFMVQENRPVAGVIFPLGSLD